MSDKKVQEPQSFHQPIYLNDPDVVWVVEKGFVDVFAVQISQGEIKGPRHHLFRACEGQSLFGIRTGEFDHRLGLIAVCEFNARLKKIFSTALSALELSKISGGAQGWVKDLAAHAFSEAPDTQKDFDWDRLQEFHKDILSKLESQFVESQRKEEVRYRIGRQAEALAIENAFSQLVAIQNAKQEMLQVKLHSNHALLRACQAVGESAGIQVIEPSHFNPQEDPRRLLMQIAKASRIRTRWVLLRGPWWGSDCGPLLGFLKENDAPVALTPVSRTHYKIFNPQTGTQKILNQEIAAELQPYAMVFYKPFSEKILRAKEVFNFAAGKIKGELWMVLMMGLAIGILNMLIPVATGMIFDSVIPGSDRSQLFQLALGLVIAAVASASFTLVRSFALVRIEGKSDTVLQAALWDRLINLPAPFFRAYSAGDLAMRANGISQIRMAISGTALNTLLGGIFSLFNLLLLFYFSAQLACIAVGLVCLATIFVSIAGYFQIRYQRNIFTISGKLAGLVLQFLSSGISKLRVTGAESRAFVKWADQYASQKKIAFKSGQINNILAVFNSVFPLICTMIIFACISANVDSRLSTGKFLAFNSAFSTFLTAALSMAMTLVATLNVIPLYERARPILETQPEVDEVKTDPGPIAGNLEVRHLSFRYKKDDPLILEDVSFEAKAGEFIALVGPSGSGKSTFLRLILGFEKPDSGSIYLDGQELSGLDIRSVRQQMGVVLQNGRLLSGDIFTNIVGSSPLTMDDAWEAARMAGLDKDIEEMSMQMQTVLNEGASTLSGGQRQRLMIARAIVRKPRILLFDEATSALDNQTQNVVSRSLESLKATRIVIAHRLSTIMNADRIYVVVKGKVIQTGTYHELMQQEGPFAELVKRQIA